MDKTASAYGKALFELALEEKALESVSAQLDVLTEVLETTQDAKELLLYSQLPKQVKKEILQKTLNASESDLVRNFMMVLIDKDRMVELNEIILAYKQFVNDHLGITVGKVASAVALKEEQLAKLIAVFSQKLNKKVKLETVVDPQLVGGYRVSIDGAVYDNTVRFQLDNLKSKLMTADLNV